MSKINHKKFVLEVDILSLEDKRQIVAEIDKLVNKINEKEREDSK